MKGFEFKQKRYVIQARREREKEWSEWTHADNYDDAVKHAKRAEEAGYCSRIIDRGKTMDKETCVACGDVIPEGRQVCPNCIHFLGCECFSGMTCDEYKEKER